MWYAVEALYRCDVDDHIKERTLYDWTVFLIQVRSKAHVEEKAHRVARTFETDYLNEAKARVSWRLVKVIDYHDLCEEVLSDGIEVHSRLFHEGDSIMWDGAGWHVNEPSDEEQG